jgi:outer membrane protein TolC
MLRSFSSLLAGCTLMLGVVHAQDVLTLSEAERRALDLDPATHAFSARADAFRAQAVAEDQLPDPMLRFGVENLPTDSYALDAEPMTQLSVGLVQQFPRGRTRSLRAQRNQAQAQGEEARATEQRLNTLRATRRAWLELWYQTQALETVRAASELFRRLVEITEAQYAAGRDNQQTVLEARVEAARLVDREITVQTAVDAARAELARWVGAEAAQRPLPEAFVPLPVIPELAALEASLLEHPALGGESAEILASEKEVELARQDYRPAFTLDVSYGKRYGEDDGEARSDMVTAMIEMELPLFPGNRQDRRLAASEQRANAARYARDDRVREMRARLQAAYAAWGRLGERLERYRRDVLPQSALNATAADRAYRNRTAPFGTLVRAQLSDLESRLDALRMETDHAQAQATLAYFAGVLS